jgi:hypothetical protein
MHRTQLTETKKKKEKKEISRSVYGYEHGQERKEKKKINNINATRRKVFRLWLQKNGPMRVINTGPRDKRDEEIA